jgi:NAD(P)-dependent dehydrogenase (short-subunit alcohol dehydrogenase family)
MARERYDIRGRTVLITGAARGIGAEAARQLAAKGANLALVGLEPEELEARAAEIGGQAIAIEADVTDVAALENAVGETIDRFGGIDVVVANAGIAPMGTITTIDPAEFERTIEVNLLGVWRTVRVTLPHVIERRGYILPVASLAAAIWIPMMAHYNMAKAGVDAFASTLRQEIKHTGTEVGCAYFGVIETDMVAGAMSHPAVAYARQNSSSGFLRKGAPVSAAGEAITRGIERRSRRVYAPPWVLPMLYARGILQPIVERIGRTDEAAQQAIRMAESAGRSASSVNGSKH